jgi:hypothetical protein
MKARFPLTGADKSAPGFGGVPRDDILPAGFEDHACCCPAYPVVRVVMPPTPERRHSVDLLLCGHHYRVSRQALAAAQARIENLPGKADAAAAAMLEAVHCDQAEVR